MAEASERLPSTYIGLEHKQQAVRRACELHRGPIAAAVTVAAQAHLGGGLAEGLARLEPQADAPAELEEESLDRALSFDTLRVARACSPVAPSRGIAAHTPTPKAFPTQTRLEHLETGDGATLQIARSPDEAAAVRQSVQDAIHAQAEAEAEAEAEAAAAAAAAAARAREALRRVGGLELAAMVRAYMNMILAMPTMHHAYYDCTSS